MQEKKLNIFFYNTAIVLSITHRYVEKHILGHWGVLRNFDFQKIYKISPDFPRHFCTRNHSKEEKN